MRKAVNPPGHLQVRTVRAAQAARLKIRRAVSGRKAQKIRQVRGRTAKVKKAMMIRMY